MPKIKLFSIATRKKKSKRKIQSKAKKTQKQNKTKQNFSIQLQQKEFKPHIIKFSVDVHTLLLLGSSQLLYDIYFKKIKCGKKINCALMCKVLFPALARDTFSFFKR